jgi:hypothetical protein
MDVIKLDGLFADFSQLENVIPANGPLPNLVKLQLIQSNCNCTNVLWFTHIKFQAFFGFLLKIEDMSDYQ